MERAGRAAMLLVALCAAAVYAHSIGNGFVWDDAIVVPQGRGASLWRVLLSADEVGSYFRPLTRASFVLDWRLAGQDPRWYHAVGVLLHACNAALLFALARRLSGKIGVAIVASALLAVHPICAEAVNFVSARNNLFALCFSLASAVLFVDGRARLSAAAFLLGLLSKEPAAMTLPVLALWAGRGRLRLLAPHALAAAGYLALRVVAVGAPPVASAGLLARLSDDVWIVPRYLALVLFPRDLTIFHRAPLSPSVAWIAAAWLGLAALALWVVRERSPASVFGLAWFGFGLLPILNLVPIPSAPIAERYLYVPAAGLWLVAADALERVRRARPRAVPAAVASLCVALAARTVARSRDWHDDVSLARSAVEVDAGSVRARYNLGVVLLESGRLGDARREWEEALRLDPADGETLTQLGTAAASSGDLRAGEAYWRRAIAADAPPPPAHFNLARAYERTGRTAEAIAEYRAFLRAAAGAYGMAGLVEVARERLRRLGVDEPAGAAKPEG